MRGLGNENLENLLLETWKAENAQIFKKIEKGVHERRIDGKLVDQGASTDLKKSVMTAANPHTTFQCECPPGIAASYSFKRAAFLGDSRLILYS